MNHVKTPPMKNTPMKTLPEAKMENAVNPKQNNTSNNLMVSDSDSSNLLPRTASVGVKLGGVYAVIFPYVKPATQSGMDNILPKIITENGDDTGPRQPKENLEPDFWIFKIIGLYASRPNQTIGWPGRGDSYAQVSLHFPNLQAALAHAKKLGIGYHVIPTANRKLKPKSYADNFSATRQTPWTH